MCETYFLINTFSINKRISRSTEPEDMEVKYLRVVSSSLMALKLFLKSVPLESQASHMEKYREFLKENKFWKLGKHSNNMVTISYLYGSLQLISGIKLSYLIYMGHCS